MSLELGLDRKSSSVSSLFDVRLGKTLERIRSSLGMSASDFSSIMDLDLPEYRRILSQDADFTIPHVLKLSKNTGISIGNILAGKIDYNILPGQFYLDKPLLPERYSVPVQQLARVRTVQSILYYLKTARGEGYSATVLRRLQVKPSYFSNSENFTSPLLVEDLLTELSSDGFSDTQIRRMGVFSFLINRNTKIGKLLAEKKDPRDLYRSVHEELLGCFDQIWNYRLLMLADDHCLVEIKTKSDSYDIFRTRSIGTREICLCRQGVFSSMLGYLGHSFASINEVECMYQGSNRCVYRLEWTPRPLSLPAWTLKVQ